MKKLSTRISIAALGLVGTTGGAFAQDVAVAVPTDSVFILNSLLFLIGGFCFLDGRGFCHARGGIGAFQKRHDAVDQEYGALFLGRGLLLSDRIQPYVSAGDMVG